MNISLYVTLVLTEFEKDVQILVTAHGSYASIDQTS